MAVSRINSLTTPALRKSGLSSTLTIQSGSVFCLPSVSALCGLSLFRPFLMQCRRLPFSCQFLSQFLLGYCSLWTRPEDSKENKCSNSWLESLCYLSLHSSWLSFFCSKEESDSWDCFWHGPLNGPDPISSS